MAKVLTHRGIEVHQMYPDNEFYWRPKEGPARKATSKVDAIAQINRYLGAEAMPRIEAERASINASRRIVDDQMIDLWATVERLSRWLKDNPRGSFTLDWVTDMPDERGTFMAQLSLVTKADTVTEWAGYHRSNISVAINQALEAYRTNTQKGKA